MKTVLPFLTALTLCCCSPAGNDIVPLPQDIEYGRGKVVISPASEVKILDESREMEYAADAFYRLAGQLQDDGCPGDSDMSAAADIVFSIDSILPRSGYRMELLPGQVNIKGGDAAGCFYAVQTLRQLVHQASSGRTGGHAAELRCMEITDAPYMEYRGMMLDVARHFFTVDEVKEVLDIMAMHKLNILHWHLTDDQGWRIEIDKYPRLTSVGSVRKRTIIGKDPGGEYDETTQYDDTPHGGFYTKEQIREVVEYAARRFITVVPEVEFPGHAVAALASYPWLGCTGEQYEVRQTWDIDDRVFCIGKESTFSFMEDVLSEVMEQFPSAYIHLGGDECPDKMWRKCAACRQRMENEHLDSFRALQGYGIARLGGFLESHGRHLIGWDEILEAGVTPSSVVMSWRGAEGGIKAAESGNMVIMCPTEYCYFDYYQFPDIENEPLAWGGLITLEKAYGFDPYAGLDRESASNILGVQANLWTEYISTVEGLEYMMLPRLAALSETAWSYDRKDWAGFSKRMEKMVSLYDACGYIYAGSAENED